MDGSLGLSEGVRREDPAAVITSRGTFDAAVPRLKEFVSLLREMARRCRGNSQEVINICRDSLRGRRKLAGTVDLMQVRPTSNMLSVCIYQRNIAGV